MAEISSSMSALLHLGIVCLVSVKQLMGHTNTSTGALRWEQWRDRVIHDDIQDMQFTNFRVT